MPDTHATVLPALSAMARAAIEPAEPLMVKLGLVDNGRPSCEQRSRVAANHCDQGAAGEVQKYTDDPAAADCTAMARCSAASVRGQSLGAVTDERPDVYHLALGNVSVAPRASSRNAAMHRAEALAAAAGRAGWVADFITVPFDPPLCNLRYRLLLWAACTRNPLLRDALPEFRRKARNAVACYRALERAAVLAEVTKESTR